MDRAHVRNGQIIKMFNGPSGYLVVEDGRKTDVSRIDIGWSLGNDRLIAVVEEVQDTSTGTIGVVKTDTGYQLEADRVYRLITIRDKTQAELDADADKEATQDLEFKTGKAMFRLANEIQALKGQQPLTVAQFKNWWKNL